MNRVHQVSLCTMLCISGYIFSGQPDENQNQQSTALDPQEQYCRRFESDILTQITALEEYLRRMHILFPAHTHYEHNPVYLLNRK